jgi:MarR-like DNA-binding transcriptional regulator SgrR of sgrS sRNA
MSNAPRPLTPEMIADRWGCSAGHVRNLIRALPLQEPETT